MASSTQWTWVWASSKRWWKTGEHGVHGVAKSWTQLSDWKTIAPQGGQLNKLENNFTKEVMTLADVLGTTADFPPWRLGKGAEYSQGIWLWRPVDYDYGTSTGLGRRDSWRAQTKLCAHQNSGERGSDPIRTRARLACVRLGVYGGGGGQWWPAHGQGHWLRQSWEAWHAGVSPSEGCCHYHYYPYHSLASVQTIGREHSPTHQQKIGFKTYWAWSCPP